MPKNKKTVAALMVTLVMTVVITVLRVTLVPWLQSMDTGLFGLSYLVVGIMLVTMILLFVLLCFAKRDIPDLPQVQGKWLLLIAVLICAVGVCILVTTVLEAYNWLTQGIAPPPGEAVNGSVDRIALMLSMLLGLLAAIYFLRLGIAWMRAGEGLHGLMPIWALAPAFWIWMRLARYEVSYASAVEVHESFYDFAMLLVSMLFLFVLARQVADVGAKKPYATVFLALCTVFMSVSGSAARVILFLMGEGDAYRAGQLAGSADFAVGLLAGALAVYWLLVPRETASVTTDMPAEKEVALQEDESTIFVAEVLKDIVQAKPGE